MPMTSLELPIIPQFLHTVEMQTGMSAPPSPADQAAVANLAGAIRSNKDGPSKGVVLGPDGKPCRSCTSSAAWKTMMKKQIAAPNSTTVLSSSATKQSDFGKTVSQMLPQEDCPADVEQLGRSAWTLLHSVAAQYPQTPTRQQQNDARNFLGSFSRLYPCFWCAEDFQNWMRQSGNAPKVSSREEFGSWLCNAHNAVNEKLGKPEFDCRQWEQRWRTGWQDGRCD